MSEYESQNQQKLNGAIDALTEKMANRYGKRLMLCWDFINLSAALGPPMRSRN